MQYAPLCGGNNFRKTVSGKTIEKTIAVRKLLCYNNSILKNYGGTHYEICM